MLTEKQKFCTKCGARIVWDEVKKPTYFDPVHGQPRFYVRGECPNRRLKPDLTHNDHSFGLVTQSGMGGEPYPIPFGIMDNHPAVNRYIELKEALPE